MVGTTCEQRGCLLDLLRDQLCESYGDEITATMHAASTAHPNGRQIALDCEDEPGF
jgi:hypothetical protein